VRRLLPLVLGAWLQCAGAGWAQELRTLTVTALDPTGGRLVGATVVVTSRDGVVAEVVTDNSGIARVVIPQGGPYTLRVESEGFEPVSQEVTVRRDSRRTVRLPLAKVYETVEVGRDPRERASDPRDDIFATILGEAQIRELPDDPDEMERVLREMAGPGAVMRVNGFRGGRLPPKDQIARIRFRRNMFAADAHEPGFLAVDIVTKPGLEGWRGSSGLGFRDTALNARNAFAPVRGEERYARGTFTLSGPLWRGHTSLALSVDGSDAYDAQTIVAALPGGPVTRNIRRPADATNVSLRVEHGLTASQQLRAEVQRNNGASDNLGVGNFDLEDRAYRQTRDEQVIRASLTGGIGRVLYNELRASVRRRDIASVSAVQAPAVVVLNAFSAGGAQVDGSRMSTDWELADDLDIARGRHALRTGLLLQGGRYETSEWRNAIGTFTFASLEAYARAEPIVFTRTAGDPRAGVRQVQAGAYLQDDFRASRTLTLSGGVRVEQQSHVAGPNVGPRGGFAWSPFESGRTTIRGGGGVFFDWFEAQDYLRAIQSDGTRQRVETVVSPGFPAVGSDEPVWLSNGRTLIADGLRQPRLTEMSVAVDHALAAAVRLGVTWIHRRGSRLLRGVDVNAPDAAGVRPDPFAGPITEVRASARSAFDALNVNLNIANPERRLFVAANYQLSRTTNESDTPFDLPANAADPSAERGPAADDARHRVMAFGSMRLGRGLSAGLSATARSALPYDITTGRDDNGDAVLRDRPAGVSRNAGRGSALVDVSARLAWRVGFGGARPAGPAGPQVRIVRGGDANPLAGMPGGDSADRYGLEVYAQAFNALNRANPSLFGGVMASPFFGRPVAAAAPRRLEVGVRLTF
jgi:hypothetical protein